MIGKINVNLQAADRVKQATQV